MNFKVVPIPSEITKSVRQNMRSPQYGHLAFAETATGYGPCRECLKTFKEGRDERILFTYNAFENLSDLPLPGPVFIHSEECKPFDRHDFPQDLAELPLLFEGFGEKSALVTTEEMIKARKEDQIAEILSLPGVKFINVRNAQAGCFVARIDRI